MPATPIPTFSVFLPQVATSYSMLKEKAALIENLGFDGLWLIDHMWQGGPDVDCFEGWTALSALAEATERLRLGLLVTCNSFRHPALLAKMAATADHISGGRLELGMGAGWMEEEHRAYGWDFPEVGVRLGQLEESLEIITGLFKNERTTLGGSHYRLLDAPFSPKPLQDPLPITIGGAGKKVLLSLVARFASRWNCPMPDAHRMAELIEALDRHCTDNGRDRREISISEQTAVVVGRDRGEVAAKHELAKTMIGGFVDLATMAVIGTPEEVARGLEAKTNVGVDDFAILFGDFAMEDTLEVFASEVIPALRHGR